MAYEYALTKGTILRHSSVLGRENVYTIEDVLGQGGFGITYLASSTISVGNTEHKLYFAIKEFFVKGQCWRDSSGKAVAHKNFWRKIVDFFSGNRRIALENDCIMRYSPAAKIEIEECLKDFIEEANRLNRICREDEHIVNVNEIFEANGTAYYVMEFLNGGSLRDRVLKKGSPIEESEAISYIVPIAQAVAHIHNKHRLLHCDISPDNIILHNTERGNILPVLIDFGEALHFNSKGILTTKHNTIGAKDGYAPQEQYKGVASYSPQIDVYALAATLYYLVCARQPISAFDIDADYIDKNLPSYISANVRHAIKHGMEKDKKLRTQTVEELLYELTGERATEEKQKEIDELFPSELPAGFKLNLGGSIYQILEKVGNSSYYLQYKAIHDNGEKNNGQTKHATIYVYEFFDPYSHKRNEDLSISTKNDDTQSRSKYNELYHMHSSGSLFETNGTLYFTQIKQIKVPLWKRMKSIFPNTTKGKLLFTLGVVSIIFSFIIIGRNYIYNVKGKENYAIAMKYLEDKDTTAAIPYLESAVKYGNPTAMAELGECYFRGNGGMERDTIRAYNLIKKKKEKGDAVGQQWLADFYEHGHYIQKDSIKAFQLYELSALQGNGKAMRKLGNCYKYGIGVKKDSISAFNWYLKSAKSGNAYGMDILGNCYLDGYGVKPDTIKAFKWYKKSAELGDDDGQSDLGWCYQYGHGVKRDTVEAMKWYEKAALQDNIWAMDRIARNYYYGNCVVKNEKEAFKWYLKIANLDNAEGMYNVGRCYYEGKGVELNKKTAYDWYLKSAQKGFDEAQNALGDIFHEKKEYKEALQWYNKAAEQDNKEALVSLGFYYFFSWGVKGDSTKAVYYWEEGMKWKSYGKYQTRYGNTAAMYNLGLCYENGWGTEKNAIKSKYWYNREKGIESDSTSVLTPKSTDLSVSKKKNSAPQNNTAKKINNFDNVQFDDL